MKKIALSILIIFMCLIQSSCRLYCPPSTESLALQIATSITTIDEYTYFLCFDGEDISSEDNSIMLSRVKRFEKEFVKPSNHFLLDRVEIINQNKGKVYSQTLWGIIVQTYPSIYNKNNKRIDWTDNFSKSDYPPSRLDQINKIDKTGQISENTYLIKIKGDPDGVDTDIEYTLKNFQTDHPDLKIEYYQVSEDDRHPEFTKYYYFRGMLIYTTPKTTEANK